MQAHNDKSEFEREIAFNLSLINKKKKKLQPKNESEANVKLEQDKELFKKEIDELK